MGREDDMMWQSPCVVHAMGFLRRRRRGQPWRLTVVSVGEIVIGRHEARVSGQRAKVVGVVMW